MEKILHYIFCFFNIINVFFREILFVWINNHFFSFFRFLKCIFLLLKNADVPAPRYSLEHYYPDMGKLSDARGYKHKEIYCDLSIIIPMYNSEKYIKECLDSILSQNTDYTYEIILMDDGSTDGTSKVIIPYLDNENIKLFRQKNSGQSSARNNALCESRGEYIMFVDSDDVLLADAIKNLMDAAKTNNSDIVEGNVTQFFAEITDDMLSDATTKPYVFSYKTNPRFVLPCLGYSVAKVYRRELWDTARFPEGYIFEDTITKFILRKQANKVVFIGVPVYGYRYVGNSSTRGAQSLKKLDSIWVYPKIVELCKQQDLPFDDTFYLLSLNHIGLLNYLTVSFQEESVRLAAFCELRNQLLSIREYRAKRIPPYFRLLEKAILDNNYNAWLYIAETIHKYKLLKKWREIN